MRRALFGLALTTLVLAFATTATGGPNEPAAVPGCAKSSLNLVEDGKLSLATDNPAFDPWWSGGSKSKDWEINDPSTGKGYESAVAYQIARRLGFTKAQVTWKAVPFLRSFAPGKKPFDWYMAQVSVTSERKNAVSFSLDPPFHRPGDVRAGTQNDLLSRQDGLCTQPRVLRPGGHPHGDDSAEPR